MKKLIATSTALVLCFGFPPLLNEASAAGLLEQLQGTVTQTLGQTDTPPSQSILSNSDIIAGLKDALRVGTERVVNQIGAQGGYNNDPDIHIPLPPTLQKAQDTLRKFGLSGMADDVEAKLNQGAEVAAPKAKELIWNAIQNMTLEDAKRIYNGPDDAATQYFAKVSTGELQTTIRPVIDQSLKEVGAVAAYDSLTSEYNDIPFIPDLKADLSQHATKLAIDGLFHYLAQEEAAIRNNPAQRTTEILQKVFGAQ